MREAWKGKAQRVSHIWPLRWWRKKDYGGTPKPHSDEDKFCSGDIHFMGRVKHKGTRRCVEGASYEKGRFHPETWGKQGCFGDLIIV